MTSEGSTTDRGFAHLVEKQMRNWELSRSQEVGEGHPHDRAVFDYISISHSVGLPTAEIASRLGDQLGWPVFDRQILREMAGNDRHRERVYQWMDERDLSWVEEICLGLTENQFNRNDYFHNLIKTVLSIARRGSVIFVGHATDLILPRDSGLRVGVVATSGYCTKAHAKEQGVSLEQAAETISEFEQERIRFLRKHFHIDSNKPTRHDLIVNVERFSSDDVLTFIVSALRARGINN